MQRSTIILVFFRILQTKTKRKNIVRQNRVPNPCLVVGSVCTGKKHPFFTTLRLFLFFFFLFHYVLVLIWYHLHLLTSAAQLLSIVLVDFVLLKITFTCYLSVSICCYLPLRADFGSYFYRSFIIPMAVFQMFRLSTTSGGVCFSLFVPISRQKQTKQKKNNRAHLIRL